MSATRAPLADAVRTAVAAVTDPEYPGITIEALGILERVDVVLGTDLQTEVDAKGGDTVATVSLVPTVLGCPALGVIEADVVAAATAAGAQRVDVVWLTTPTWSTDRIRPEARQQLAQELTVAIRGSRGAVTCPVCGSGAVTRRSEFGSTLCRQVWWCEACRNPVEVLRS